MMRARWCQSDRARRAGVEGLAAARLGRGRGSELRLADVAQRGHAAVEFGREADDRCQQDRGQPAPGPGEDSASAESSRQSS